MYNRIITTVDNEKFICTKNIVNSIKEHFREIYHLNPSNYFKKNKYIKVVIEGLQRKNVIVILYNIPFNSVILLSCL